MEAFVSVGKADRSLYATVEVSLYSGGWILSLGSRPFYVCLIRRIIINYYLSNKANNHSVTRCLNVVSSTIYASYVTVHSFHHRKIRTLVNIRVLK